MIVLSGPRQITIGQPQAYPGLAGLVERQALWSRRWEPSPVPEACPYASLGAAFPSLRKTLQEKEL